VSNLRLKLVSNLIGSSLLVLLSFASVWADPPSVALAKLFPARLGEFRQVSPAKPAATLATEGILNPVAVESSTGDNPGVLSGEVEYQDRNGKRFLVEVAQFRKDSDAFSLLSIAARELRNMGVAGELVFDKVGTASLSWQNRLAFFKGSTFSRISNANSNDFDSTGLMELAQLFAEKVDRGDGEIPVLIKHLPDWPNAQKRAVYLAGIKSVQSIALNEPVLSSLDAAGDADAVLAQYGEAKMLLVEFNTPQLAGDNDRMILAKIQELRNQNQRVPTSYRRVGNYGVFVFDAGSEQAAKQLIDQVKYEQVVQWLGDNPYWLKEAEKRYVETTLGVLVAVVKASGLTLVACFGLGGLIGAILFNRRRARQLNAEAFSDAGGMLRLNLDEMTPQTDPARLLSSRN
jgi:hypothetical protein